jgi:nucleoside-diphosphate-sugar epimerase
MIVGNGMIASAFKKNTTSSSFCIFASGVSNSLEKRKNEFDREKKLLENIHKKYPNKKIVYFSSFFVSQKKMLSIPYYQHKKDIELFIEKNFNEYVIVRLPQVVGKTNNSTLLAYLVKKIKDGSLLSLQKGATRNIIDCEDVVTITLKYLKFNKSKKSTLTIISPQNISITRMVYFLEGILNKKANTRFINGGHRMVGTRKITGDLNRVLQEIDFSFPENYAQKIIKKYYGTPF